MRTDYCKLLSMVSTLHQNSETVLQMYAQRSHGFLVFSFPCRENTAESTNSLSDYKINSWKTLPATISTLPTATRSYLSSVTAPEIQDAQTDWLLWIPHY